MDIIDKRDINFNGLCKFQCSANSESKLFYDNNYMYKMFKINKDIKCKYPLYLLRKKMKIEMLSQGDSIDSAILANSLIMNDRILAGYRMNRIIDANPMFEFTSKNKNINTFLKLMNNVSLSLRNIHNDPRNIVIGDLSVSNIIFDQNMKHYFVDFDSVMVGNLPSDRIPYVLHRYAIKRGINKYSIDKSTDRFCLILATLFVIFRKSIENVSMTEYDEVAEKVETLKNMREFVLEMKKYNSLIPDLPYLDEMINFSECKKKVKVVNVNIR